MQCYGIVDVAIGNSVTSIENFAFANFSSLSSVTIPNSVTKIGDYSFSGCGSLISVTVCISIPIEIKDVTFANRQNATLYVSVGSKNTYQNAVYWKDFKDIIEIEMNDINKISHIVVEENNKNYGVYDIQGHRICNAYDAQLKKGLYIINGRKVIVR